MAAAVAEVDVSDPGQPLPDHALSLDELRRALATLLDELPPNQRIALVLCDSEDFSYKQIAAILSVTVEAVRALLLRARTTVRRRLATLL
jgi:RNA polymerase sigma-70 factor (ECF subfamily)